MRFAFIVGLATFALALLEPLGGVDLERPPSEPVRDPPDFGFGERPAKKRRR
jgi:hypothetical protein